MPLPTHPWKRLTSFQKHLFCVYLYWLLIDKKALIPILAAVIVYQILPNPENIVTLALAFGLGFMALVYLQIFKKLRKFITR